MKELAPHLADPKAFCEQLRRQHEENYRLLAACGADGTILGLAGYRAQTNTLYGRFIYLDDLVVTSRLQRSGIGADLLNKVREIARQACCAHFVLDTGLHMPLAQRLYFRNGLLAKGMHSWNHSLTAEQVANNENPFCERQPARRNEPRLWSRR